MGTNNNKKLNLKSNWNGSLGGTSAGRATAARAAIRVEPAVGVHTVAVQIAPRPSGIEGGVHWLLSASLKKSVFGNTRHVSRTDIVGSKIG